MDFSSPTFWIVAGIIFTALVFDYLNGFHDAANSIATVVSTRVLTPGKAVFGQRSLILPRPSALVWVLQRRLART